LCLFHCFWQLAHLVVSLAHSFFAASQCALVQLSTLAGTDALDVPAVAAGAGLVAGACAIAAPDSAAVTIAAIRQKLVRGLSMSSPLIVRFRAGRNAPLPDRLTIVTMTVKSANADRDPPFGRRDGGSGHF
jgi:hypothetical protein